MRGELFSLPHWEKYAILDADFPKGRVPFGKKRDLDFTNGPILWRMVLFTLPLIASGVLQLLFNAQTWPWWDIFPAAILWRLWVRPPF